jgi:hypothetical protein
MVALLETGGMSISHSGRLGSFVPLDSPARPGHNSEATTCHRFLDGVCVNGRSRTADSHALTITKTLNQALNKYIEAA